MSYNISSENFSNPLLKELLEKPEVENDFTYDGIHFNKKNGEGFTLAIDGLGMLKGINESYLKSIFKFTAPPEPYPEIYKQDIESLFEVISEKFLIPVEGVKNRYVRTGTVSNSLANYEIEGVLGNLSPEEEQQAMESILASQEQVRNLEKLRKDKFFHSFLLIF